MQPAFLALLENEKDVIQRPSIELIQAIEEPIKFTVAKVLQQHVKAASDEYDLYSYYSVDIDGSYKNIELPNFVFLDLGTDDINRHYTKRRVIVKEKHTGSTREFPSNEFGVSFLKFDLLRLYRKLANAGSFATLDVYEELEVLKKENSKLQTRIKELESKYES